MAARVAGKRGGCDALLGALGEVGGDCRRIGKHHLVAVVGAPRAPPPSGTAAAAADATLFYRIVFAYSRARKDFVAAVLFMPGRRGEYNSSVYGRG